MTSKNKMRLDSLLVEKGIFENKSRAKAAVMEGIVFVDGVKVNKPGTQVKDTVEISIAGDRLAYVSRGGLKLEKALKEFDLVLSGKTVLDIGASTGGFTDCALKNGAKKVFAVDVGYGQLAWELRQDPRVQSMERTNARYLTPEDVGEKVDLVTIDVSFISLEKILPVAAKILAAAGEVVALVKPQFEAGRDRVGKKGVVRDPAVHKDVLEEVVSLAETSGLKPIGLTYSPIRGPQGNIEYIACFSKEARKKSGAIDIAALVRESWQEL